MDGAVQLVCKLGGHLSTEVEAVGLFVRQLVLDVEVWLEVQVVLVVDIQVVLVEVWKVVQLDFSKVLCKRPTRHR